MRLNFVLGKEKAKKKNFMQTFMQLMLRPCKMNFYLLEVEGGLVALTKLLQKYFNRKLQVH